MKSKLLVWYLVSCVFVLTAASGKDRMSDLVSLQDQDNLSRDVTLNPVKTHASARQTLPSSEPFSISATFDANVTSQQRAVFQQAINEWTAIIQTRGVTP